MHHTRALILKKQEWHEVDCLVTVLTRDFGKIRLFVQGVRKHGAKLQGHIEPMRIADISFVIGKNGYRMTTAELVRPFPDMSNSFAKVQAFERIARALDHNLFTEEERAGELFGLVEGVLETIERSHVDHANKFVQWFFVRFMDFLGVFPSSGSKEASVATQLHTYLATPIERLEHMDINENELTREFRNLTRYIGSVSFPEPVTLHNFHVY